MAVYPLDQNDSTRERLHLMTSFYTSMHDACYDKCAQNNDLTFLSIQEGKCFRNCLTKVSYYYPTIQTNLQGAAFKHQDELTNKLKAKHGLPTVPNLSVNV